MLQPEMSEVAMGVNGRRMTTMRRRDSETDNDKKDHSILGNVVRFIRFLVPHIALFGGFFLYLVFGAYIFTILEGPSSEASSYQADMDNVKNEMYTMITNMSVGRLPQTALAGHSPSDSNEVVTESVSEVDRDEIEERIDEMIERMMRPEWKIARMESMQVGRAWSLSSGLLFCMTTITTIGKSISIAKRNDVKRGVYQQIG